MTATAINLEGLVGLIPVALGEKLRGLAKAVQRKHAIVEIGSFKGMSTCYLAAGAIEGHGAMVYAIDPWDLPGNVYGKHGFTDPAVREAFTAQLQASGVARQVVPIRDFGAAAGNDWKGPKVGLLYIDGDHDYSSVRDDFSAWRPHLATGAVVAFDDYGTRRNPGVQRAVDQLRQAGVLADFSLEAGQLAVTRYAHG